MIKTLEELYERALENYRVSGSDYDAGILEGLKRAMEIVSNE